MNNNLLNAAHIAAANFIIKGKIISCDKYGNGHINSTFLVTTDSSRYILQRINQNVFKNPIKLMENIINVTEFLRTQITARGGDPTRETLNLLPTKNDKFYYIDAQSQIWRCYLYVEDTYSLESVENPDDIYRSALTFGKFQNALSTFPAEKLHETIPNFHNTPSRYNDFLCAVNANLFGRLSDVTSEFEFIKAREKDMSTCYDMQKNGALPLRVTHNDTKLNNVLLDSKSGDAICVIDLDTVMPGLSVFDFGDSIRFGANTAAEDETDLSKVSLDLHLFELFTKGFLKGCSGSLTENEIDMLPMGAKLMTLECGMRFLTDYLQGDTYFAIHKEHHNLHRCKTQLALVADMEKKWSEMHKIVDKYR